MASDHQDDENNGGNASNETKAYPSESWAQLNLCTSKFKDKGGLVYRDKKEEQEIVIPVKAERKYLVLDK